MHFFKWRIGGVIGGAVGSAIWVGIENFTQGEYGWIAWPVGLLVGWGVHKAASADTRGGFLRGAVAAVLALAAVMGAKYTKTALLQAQAKNHAQSISVASGKVVPKDNADSDAMGGAVEEIPEVVVPLDTAIFQGQGTGRSSSAIKEMDMVWICLAALTAYLVGKGPGPSSKPQGDEASADAKKDDDAESDESND